MFGLFAGFGRCGFAELLCDFETKVTINQLQKFRNRSAPEEMGQYLTEFYRKQTSGMIFLLSDLSFTVRHKLSPSKIPQPEMGG
jgi:hypothetical protein